MGSARCIVNALPFSSKRDTLMGSATMVCMLAVSAKSRAVLWLSGPAVIAPMPPPNCSSTTFGIFTELEKFPTLTSKLSNPSCAVRSVTVSSLPSEVVTVDTRLSPLDIPLAALAITRAAVARSSLSKLRAAAADSCFKMSRPAVVAVDVMVLVGVDCMLSVVLDRGAAVLTAARIDALLREVTVRVNALTIVVSVAVCVVVSIAGCLVVMIAMLFVIMLMGLTVSVVVPITAGSVLMLNVVIVELPMDRLLEVDVAVNVLDVLLVKVDVDVAVNELNVPVVEVTVVVSVLSVLLAVWLVDIFVVV